MTISEVEQKLGSEQFDWWMRVYRTYCEQHGIEARDDEFVNWLEEQHV